MLSSKLARVSMIALLAFFACDDDDDNFPLDGGGQPATIPAAWQGEWNITTLAQTCDQPDTLLLSESVEFLCDGEPLSTRFLPIELECEGTVTDTRVDVECDFDGSEGSCRLRVNVDWTMTRSGDEFAGTARVNWVASGGCDPDTTLCVDFTFTGTRIGDGLDGCFPR